MDYMGQSHFATPSQKPEMHRWVKRKKSLNSVSSLFLRVSYPLRTRPWATEDGHDHDFVLASLLQGEKKPKS